MRADLFLRSANLHYIIPNAAWFLWGVRQYKVYFHFVQLFKGIQDYVILILSKEKDKVKCRQIYLCAQPTYIHYIIPNAAWFIWVVRQYKVYFHFVHVFKGIQDYVILILSKEKDKVKCRQIYLCAQPTYIHYIIPNAAGFIWAVPPIQCVLFLF